MSQTSSMHVRLAADDDFASVMELYHRASDAMVGSPYDCCWRCGGHPTPGFVRGLVTSGNMLVAVRHTKVVGAVGMDHDLGHDYQNVRWLVDAPKELVCVIHLLVIDQESRREGRARELLRACLAEARRRGMRTARLDATGNNAPAIGLYASEGFLQVGAGELEIGPPGRTLVPFVVMELPL